MENKKHYPGAKWRIAEMHRNLLQDLRFFLISLALGGSFIFCAQMANLEGNSPFSISDTVDEIKCFWDNPLNIPYCMTRDRN